ncbi:aminotransferase class III-fold pyridoxal phosphate-dependent enzyme [Sandaracinus amylolyticus]|uniref:Adenosylmethionine-8-amino-7-oxononanoate aminotransferase n=1 Tax=Sandaracinus amylolyticus TaxID=927083 RepID=A0A0F6SGW3_9BACT|nr:aminotransferase class III-fold pyridoxal phosphate-dependent enzyme [Sandaracinus amylolyticus]AKF09394.1 Adenosylmethionine-8-amino-7-oxononanoate aminotransferase [Sandaracinus amylolyticus]
MSEHPFFFTWSAQRGAKPVEIVGGEGASFDVREGERVERWLDMGSLSYQANLGHGCRRVIDAMKRQCDELLLTVPSGGYPAKDALARKLLEHAPPGFTKVFFTLGGAEAVENALKIARLATGRHKAISRYRSYHGATMGALTLSGDHRRPPLEPGLAGVVHVLDQYESRLPGGARVIEGGADASAIARTIELEGPETIAAIFLEPVPGANGALVPPAGYWSGVRGACDRHGIVLVADCVLDGFGRLGSWYGFERLGATPDLITISKGLTGGYAPLGAVLVHERIAKLFEDRVLLAGLTFYGHPIGVAAGLEAVRVYEDEKLVERAAVLGARMGAEIAAMQDRRGETITKTRAMGLLAGLEIAGDAARFTRLSKALDARRVYTHPNARIRTLIVAPPLVITEDELLRGLRAIEDAIVESA